MYTVCIFRFPQLFPEYSKIVGGLSVLILGVHFKLGPSLDESCDGCGDSTTTGIMFARHNLEASEGLKSDGKDTSNHLKPLNKLFSTFHLFRDLKLTRPEPNAETASMLGMDKISIGMDELKARKLIYGVVNTITPTTSNNSPSTSPRTSTSIHASSSSTFTQVKNLSDLSLSSQRDLRTYSVPNQVLEYFISFKMKSINDNHYPPALLLYCLASSNLISLLYSCRFVIRASINWKTSFNP
ncbi:hypothetical protein MJO28_004787 [Puccinia striiformis f. sp. tritici]|uniref:Uncharacterized protein n=1 Tax=Puccinia striiformis f. sp. tritici TaxID=168172 RepID=A0ACC0EK40_9BASI|nr:hypothetical protein MJO28_004787 [Puccinia striiformis f. sp. tritici]